MVTEKLEQLRALRAKAADLEQALEAERNQELAGLPAQYGFASADAFIEAVHAATGARTARGRRRGRPAVRRGAAAAKPSAGGGRRRRAKITDETRAEVKRLVGEGKTGNEIAKQLGISLPSVQNIKKALGLVAKRGK